MKTIKLFLLLALAWAAVANAETWERRNGTYSDGAVNSTKWQTVSANREGIPSAKLDGELNHVYHALNDIEDRTAPLVTGHDGEFLTNDGNIASWAAISITSSTIDSVSATSGYSLTADGSGGTDWTQVFPAGTVLPWAGTSATVPSGFLMPYGQSLVRASYSNLFAAIGCTYTCADGTHFNLPDLRGRVVAGLDDMGGTAASRVSLTTAGISGTILGAAGGDQRMQAHNHSITDPGHTHGQVAASGKMVAVGGGGSSFAGQAATFSGLTQNQILTDSATTGITVTVSGTGASQNMQPTMMLNYIIKY